ncbi:hypothetical protein [Sphingobacterium siyangense]|uniref:hypothetical protein n=1 Tax=Sphingobacterium siyangense TaxID=459529 RepID=UPI002FDEE9CB
MKNLTKLTFALFAFTLLFTACSDDDAPQPEQVTKEITAEELLNYQVLEFYESTRPLDNGYGDWIFVHWLEKRNGKFVFRTQYSWGGYTTFNNQEAIQYNPETGITTLTNSFGYLELTKNDSNEIVVVDDFHINPSHSDGKYFKRSTGQTAPLLFKVLPDDVFFNKTYQSISLHLDGFYRFSDLKWKYNAQRQPTHEELNWNYNRMTNNIWDGGDNGTERNWNFFVIIPKNNGGWYGQHPDKDILLVNTSKNQRLLSSPIVCPLYE